MNEKQYLKLLKEAEARYLKDVEAIKRVWRLTVGGSAPHQSNDRAVQTPGGVNVAAAVLDIIKKTVGEFSIHDIAEGLKGAHPEIKFQLPYLSSVFMRLKKKTVVRMIQERRGNEPAKYVRA